MLKNLLKPLKSKLFLINSFNEISIILHDFRFYTKLSILDKIFKHDFDFLSKFQISIKISIFNQDFDFL